MPFFRLSFNKPARRKTKRPNCGTIILENKMTEIEIKARVTDRAATEAALDGMAEFKGSVTRDDAYWKKDGVQIRIRKEILGDGTESTLLTYKRKELRAEDGGSVMEVNDEQECAISRAEPLEAFLKDAGFSVALRKHKDVKAWRHSSGATLELCAVPPLGDFLEIEILSAAGDDSTVSGARKILLGLLKDAGIPESRIEGRYYSELLKETLSAREQERQDTPL